MSTACQSERHEVLKQIDAWWLRQRLLGYQSTPRGHVWELRNCLACESTLARRCTREEMGMSEPDGFWISSRGYAQLASEFEAQGHLGVADRFFARAQDAAVAAFEEACAAALVGVDEVPEELEVTETLPDPMDAYWDRLDREREAGR